MKYNKVSLKLNKIWPAQWFKDKDGYFCLTKTTKGLVYSTEAPVGENIIDYTSFPESEAIRE